MSSEGQFNTPPKKTEETAVAEQPVEAVREALATSADSEQATADVAAAQARAAEDATKLTDIKERLGMSGIKTETEEWRPQTMEEARANDIQIEVESIEKSFQNAQKLDPADRRGINAGPLNGIVMKKLAGLGTNLDEIQWRAKSAILDGGARESDYKTPQEQESLRKSLQNKEREMITDTVKVVMGLSPEAQASFAQEFYKRTLKDGVPTTEALNAYQSYFAGTPFGEKYKSLVDENFADRGIKQDIDTTRYGGMHY
jgi:hypothetical protein